MLSSYFKARKAYDLLRNGEIKAFRCGRLWIISKAAVLLMQGVPLKAVSKRLGHSLASTTSDIYGRSLPSIDDIAAETLDDILNPGSALKKKKD